MSDKDELNRLKDQLAYDRETADRTIQENVRTIVALRDQLAWLREELDSTEQRLSNQLFNVEQAGRRALREKEAELEQLRAAQVAFVPDEHVKKLEAEVEQLRMDLTQMTMFRDELAEMLEEKNIEVEQLRAELTEETEKKVRLLVEAEQLRKLLAADPEVEWQVMAKLVFDAEEEVERLQARQDAVRAYIDRCEKAGNFPSTTTLRQTLERSE